MALGPILGGTMIGFFGESAGVRMAFAVAFFLAMAALALQQKFLSEGDGELVEKAEGNPFRVFRAMSPELKNLLVSDILVRFCEQIPYPFAVVWAMKMIVEPVSAFRFGVLTAVEMIVALLIYIPVARLADRGRKKIFVVITFCFFTSFPIVLYFSRSFWPLVFAFTVRGLKEFGEPTRKSLILDLCPPGQSAAMFGLYYLLRDMLVSVAALGGAFLWMAGPAANFFTAAAFGAAGTAWFVLFGKDFPSTHAVEGGSR
jgi:MFS family permease